MASKIFHFLLEDTLKNKSTLICYYNQGEIKYQLYTGHSSSGTPEALSNLQVGYLNNGRLPLDNRMKFTKECFEDYCMSLINTDSVRKVVDKVDTNVVFEG